MGARRVGLRAWGLGGLVSVWVLVGLLAFGSASVSAAVIHEFLPGLSAKLSEGVPSVGPHGESIADPGPLRVVQSMTFDSGELYVAEGGSSYGSSRIDLFDGSSGAFVSQFPELSSPRFPYQGIAVGHSAGEAQVYVGADEYPEGNPKGVVAVLDSAGGVLGVWKGTDTPVGGFGCFACSASADIAVDTNPSSLNDWAAGDVYVTDPATKVVDVFRPLAGGGEEYVAQLPGATGVVFSEPGGVAVNPLDGEVVVSERSESEKTSNIDVFRPVEGVVGQYEFVRRLSGPLSGGAFSGVDGVTVDGGNGDIYVWEHLFEVERSFVDQFDAQGQLVGRLTGAPVASSGEVGSFHQVRSVAVDPNSHDVYVADYRGSEPTVVDVFGPDIVIPDVVTEPASSVRTEGEGRIEAALNGTVNPLGEGEASCWFVWGTTSEFGQVAKCEPEKVADGSGPVGVHTILHGLAPDTTYYFRLQASNKNGANPGADSQDLQFTTPGPGLHGLSVSAVRAESVTFDAKIDPHGAATSYYFQYGASSSYGNDVPALTPEAKYGASIGAGEEDVEVAQHIQGLSAATVYHYRVVTVSEPAPGEFEYFYSPDQTFRTQTLGVPLGLPDGRVWEMVSPPQKEGASLGWIVEGIVQASSRGDAFTGWTSFEPTEDKAAGAYGFAVPVFFGRGSGGWTSRTIAPPHSGASSVPVGNGQEYKLFSEDLSKGALQPFGLFTPLAPGVSESTPYLRTDYVNGDAGEQCGSGCYQPLVTAANVPAGTKYGDEPSGECLRISCGPTLVGATPDLSHVLVESGAALTSVPLEGHEGLFEWSDGRLQLVNVLPGGETNENGGSIPRQTWFGDQGAIARHAISDDGSRVIWEGVTRNAGARHVYLHDSVKGETVRLDEGAKSNENSYLIQYMTASSDGSRFFFTDGERLTVDSTAKPVEPDLYEYDLNAPAGSRLTDLSVSSKPLVPANVQMVLGASEDGSYVYFSAAGVLAPGATQGRCNQHETGLCNLYMRHNGTTTFIGAISSQEDTPTWGGGQST